jgi:hypothetical protein
MQLVVASWAYSRALRSERRDSGLVTVKIAPCSLEIGNLREGLPTDGRPRFIRKGQPFA